MILVYNNKYGINLTWKTQYWTWKQVFQKQSAYLVLLDRFHIHVILPDWLWCFCIKRVDEGTIWQRFINWTCKHIKLPFIKSKTIGWKLFRNYVLKISIHIGKYRIKQWNLFNHCYGHLNHILRKHYPTSHVRLMDRWKVSQPNAGGKAYMF